MYCKFSWVSRFLCCAFIVNYSSVAGTGLHRVLPSPWSQLQQSIDDPVLRLRLGTWLFSAVHWFFCRDSATHIRLAIGGVSVCLSVTRWYWLKTNKCIGDDTKAAARRSPNCVRKTKIRRRTMVVWILLPFAIWPDCSNLRVQVPKFHPNRTTRGAVMTSYTISRCRLRWLVSVSYLMMSLSSKGQNLSANQI